MKHNITVWVLSVCLGCLFFCSEGFGQYQFIDLGTLGVGDYSGAYCINNNGQIVGAATNDHGNNTPHATLFDSTGAGNNRDLGTLGGCGSVARSINNNGQIVGWAYNTDNSFGPGGVPRATLFDSTGLGNNRDLGTLGGSESWAYSINNNGQIVGWAYNSSSGVTYVHATLFDSTGLGNNRDLGTLGGGNSEAYSINDNGQIVGNADSTRIYATLFDSTGAGHNRNLEPLGRSHSYANSINNNGLIVGEAVNNSSGASYAALFDPTDAGNNRDLGILPNGDKSLAYSINNNGQIVGYTLVDYTNNDHFGSYATLFDPTGVGNNIDLNTFLPAGSGWILEAANSINDNGWIVGSGLTKGDTHAYLLKPIPEPCTLALLVLGGLAAIRRRK